MRRAVYLDRDGVIVEPVPDPRLGTWESPYRPQDVTLVSGVTAAIRRLRAAGFLVVGASNQPAAAKGTVTTQVLRDVHARARTLLEDCDASLDDWRYCLHHPDGVTAGLSRRCTCRKPNPGLLQMAAHDLGIDLAQSWMVGDSDSDISAGAAAGARTVLVEHPRTGHRRRWSGPAPTRRAPDLDRAAALICEYSAERPPAAQRSW